jgi:Sap, sulfolipid-1-addressing protein
VSAVSNLLLTVALLGLAVAFSSPVSVVAVIALLGMPKGRRRGVTFIIGWIAAIAVITGVLLAFPTNNFATSRSTPSRAVSTLELLLGIGLVVGAGVIHRRPPPLATGDREYKDPTPAWLVRLIGRHWSVAALAGSLMLTYSVTIIAASEVLKAHVNTVDRTVAMAVFALTSIVTVAAPVTYAMFRPHHTERTLYVWKRWLTVNSRNIGVVALAVIGLLVIVKAVYDLIA